MIFVEYVVDFHCDTLLKLKKEKYNFSIENKNLHVDLPKLRKACVNIQVFSIFIEQPNLMFEQVIQMIDYFYELVEDTKSLELATSIREIEEIIKNGKVAALLLLEGGDCIFDLSALRTLYRLGVRIVTLTHNNRNLIADGVGENEACGGVTRFGKKVIREMNRLGMIIDVSHLCERSFWDVLKYSKDPVIASHSNARSVCDHERNLSDEQILELAKKGGVIGINFCPSFLSERERAGLKDVAKHIRYIKDLVGIEHIGLGSDFDGISSTPTGLSHVGMLPNLFEFLIKNEVLDNEELLKFKGLNWIRIISQVLG